MEDKNFLKGDDLITVYIFFLDMEDDIPHMYVTDENICKLLKSYLPGSDYIEINFKLRDWLGFMDKQVEMPEDMPLDEKVING